MQNLLKLLKVLESTEGLPVYNYAIPDLWNCFDYQGHERRSTPWGEVLVNPYHFYMAVVRDVILAEAVDGRDYTKSLSSIGSAVPGSTDAGYHGGDWIKRATVYSSLIRASTAWDHDRTGALDDDNLYGLKDTGTFIKMIAYLPTLRRMGVDTLYLLPISAFSQKDKKGDLGSPYGVSDFFALDPNLKDPITGTKMSVEEEFKALVEACHILGIRVMIDIIPRTNSVNSNLIATHPEWFYWIRHEDLPNYRPPTVPGLGATVVPKPVFMPDVYASRDVREHIAKFVVNPRDADKAGWKRLVKLWEKGTDHLLDLVREQYGVTVAPAFSDHINDVQPPWTDVTFFRMYLDHPIHAMPFLGDEADKLAPYILFDTIKANLYPGKLPNRPLWDTLADIIPHFQREFGIDGARIDMGHALPEELVRLIISKAREIDTDFCFIAEELYPDRAPQAKALGYNMIIGQGFYMLPRIWEFFTHAYYYSSKDLTLPVFAAGETHDTPRLAARDGGRTLSRLVTLMNLFMPNGIPFINSGQEVWELQPMNTGLDCRENEAYMLPPEDLYHGKLALFDKVAFHYLNKGRWELIELLEKASAIRRTYIDTLSDPETFTGLGFESMRTHGIGLGYQIRQAPGQGGGHLLLVIANTNLYEGQRLFVNVSDLRRKSGNQNLTGRQLFSSSEPPREGIAFSPDGNLFIWLHPGEVKVLLV